jgi:hypothetical protein
LFNKIQVMPFLKKDQAHRILLLFAGLCIALLGVMIFAVPPGTDPDPCWGFMIMNSMEHGGHFNLLVSPAFQDMAKDRYEFLAWWSPGQYLLPYFFKSLFKVTTGQAVSLTIAICSLLGLAGFYRLFKQLGFTKWIAAISTAFIATQLFFVLPFTYFTGGEVLIFAFMGWFLYGCFSFKKITWQVLVFLFFSGLIGFFSKSSFLWMYAAGVACMWINISMDETNNISLSRYSKKEIITFLKNGLLLAVPFIGAVAIIYIFYLSKGITPTSDQGALLVKPETFGYPLASPMLSAFSVDELFDGLIYRPDGSTGITYHSAIILVFVLAFCSLAFMVLINRFAPTKKYLRAIYVFYIIGVIFFSYMYLKQATISYESRHFRIIGLLCLPGFIYLLFKTKVTKAIFFIAWIYFAYMSFNFFRINYNGNKGAAKGNTGLSQVIYDKRTLDEIVKIDREHHNAVFVVMSSDIGAEIYNNRVITMEDDMPDDFFATLKYRGKAGPVYILMPARYLKNGRELNIIKAFTDYHNFASRQLGPDYYLYYAEN